MKANEYKPYHGGHPTPLDRFLMVQITKEIKESPLILIDLNKGKLRKIYPA